MPNPKTVKVQRNYSLDQKVAEEFDSFCPPGERSNTLNELLKDYLERHGRLNVNQEELLTEKSLALQRLSEEVESMKAKMASEEKERKDAVLRWKVEAEARDLNSKINEEAKDEARVKALEEMGFGPEEQVPESLHEKFIFLWRSYTKKIIEKKIQEVSV